MIEYKINVKESLMDKLLFRNEVNCSVDIVAHSDDGVYYEGISNYYNFGDPCINKFSRYTYDNLKFNKVTNELTEDSKVKVKSVISNLKLARPGVTELVHLIGISEKNFNEFIEIRNRQKLDDTYVFSGMRTFKCSVSVLIDSDMYNKPKMCFIELNNKYIVNFYNKYLPFRMSPIRYVYDREDINYFIESLERRD